jgi:hypothetical protein
MCSAGQQQYCAIGCCRSRCQSSLQALQRRFVPYAPCISLPHATQQRPRAPTVARGVAYAILCNVFLCAAEHLQLQLQCMPPAAVLWPPGTQIETAGEAAAGRCVEAGCGSSGGWMQLCISPASPCDRGGAGRGSTDHASPRPVTNSRPDPAPTTTGEQHTPSNATSTACHPPRSSPRATRGMHATATAGSVGGSGTLRVDYHTTIL